MPFRPNIFGLPQAKPYGNFGTMLVMAEGAKVEITPYRDDAPGRKPNYTFGAVFLRTLPEGILQLTLLPIIH